MERTEVIGTANVGELFGQLNELHATLGAAFKQEFDRSLPFSDEVFDRWERAASLGFGKGTSIYDSAYVFGTVEVGENTWIGPFTVIDGSGGLQIGKHCTISVGVQLYTHDNMMQTLSGGIDAIERSPVSIGDCTYIGPNCVVKRGVRIGKHCLIGTGSYVNRDLPDFSIAVGSPARIVGEVSMESEKPELIYFNAP